MINYILLGGWSTPLKKIRVRQFGWWHSQLNGRVKLIFQSPPVMQQRKHRISVSLSAKRSSFSYPSAKHDQWYVKVLHPWRWEETGANWLSAIPHWFFPVISTCSESMPSPKRENNVLIFTSTVVNPTISPGFYQGPTTLPHSPHEKIIFFLFSCLSNDTWGCSWDCERV